MVDAIRAEKEEYMFTKRVWFVMAFTISLLMVAAPLKGADSKEQVYKAIQSTYAGIEAALSSKDVNTACSFYTRDYASISQKGERKSLEDMQKEVAQVLTNPNVKSIKCIETIEKLILEGDTATVFCKTMSTVAIVNPQTGGNNVMVTNNRGIDTWVKQNGRWLIKQTETLTYAATINGKPVPQETQPGLAQQNTPPIMPLNPQQPGNEQSPH